MKKIILGTLASMTGIAFYYITFMIFADSWFPYYYEQYISSVFLAGLILLILLPIPASFISTTSIGRLGYFRSVTWLNLLVVILCVVIFVYMLSNGVFLSSPGVYQVTP